MSDRPAIGDLLRELAPQVLGVSGGHVIVGTGRRTLAG
jgi:hypothetical protein